MTYDPHAALAALDANPVPFLALGAITMVFNYIYFATGIINARRDKVFAFPLAASTVWFAHDLSFVLLWHDWFVTFDHWYLKLFWVALIPTTLFEVAYIHQAWTYGQDELLPGSSRSAFLRYILLATLTGCIAWWSVKYFLDDPIFIYTFASTGFLAVAFGIPRYLRRGDTGGQSVAMWISYCCMQTLWYFTTALYFGPAFRHPAYLLLGAACVAGGLFMAAACRRAQQPSLSPA